MVQHADTKPCLNEKGIREAFILVFMLKHKADSSVENKPKEHFTEKCAHSDAAAETGTGGNGCEPDCSSALLLSGEICCFGCSSGDGMHSSLALLWVEWVVFASCLCRCCLLWAVDNYFCPGHISHFTVIFMTFCGIKMEVHVHISSTEKMCREQQTIFYMQIFKELVQHK